MTKRRREKRGVTKTRERRDRRRNGGKGEGSGRTKNSVAPTMELPFLSLPLSLFFFFLSFLFLFFFFFFFMNIRTRANKFECARRKGRQTWSGSPFAVDRPRRLASPRQRVMCTRYPRGRRLRVCVFEGGEGQVRLRLPFVEKPSKNWLLSPHGSHHHHRRRHHPCVVDSVGSLPGREREREREEGEADSSTPFHILEFSPWSTVRVVRSRCSNRATWG